MRKHAYFASRDIEGWPEPAEIEHYFLGPPGTRWFFETRNDSAGFSADGINGTENLDDEDERRIDIELNMWGDPDHGVMLIWSKWGGGFEEMYTSKGDMSRLRDLIRTTHDTPMPIGLYIPFEEAWKAVKDFLEADGERSTQIEWVENSTLPKGTFPDP